jgi:hypothetical protein
MTESVIKETVKGMGEGGERGGGDYIYNIYGDYRISKMGLYESKSCSLNTDPFFCFYKYVIPLRC